MAAGVEELAASGYITGASNRNWAGYGEHVKLNNVPDVIKALLTDPQTSGGLLVACEPGAVDDVLTVFRAEGFERAAVVGSLTKAMASTLADRMSFARASCRGSAAGAFVSPRRRRTQALERKARRACRST